MPRAALSVTAPKASVPGHVTKLQIGGETVEGGVIYKEITAKLDASYVSSVIYSAYLCDQNMAAVALAGPVTIAMKAPAGLNVSKTDVFLYDSQAKTMKKLEAQVQDGKLVFETSVVDHIILASRETVDSDPGEKPDPDESQASKPDEVDNVDTGEGTLLPAALLLFGASASAAARLRAAAENPLDPICD